MRHRLDGFREKKVMTPTGVGMLLDYDDRNARVHFRERSAANMFPAHRVIGLTDCVVFHLIGKPETGTLCRAFFMTLEEARAFMWVTGGSEEQRFLLHLDPHLPTVRVAEGVTDAKRFVLRGWVDHYWRAELAMPWPEWGDPRSSVDTWFGDWKAQHNAPVDEVSYCAFAENEGQTGWRIRRHGFLYTSGWVDFPASDRKPEVSRVPARNQGAQVFCDNCGHIMVRQGSGHKCLNCGNSVTAA